MTVSASAFFRFRYERLILPYDDDAVDDDLLRHLVSTVYYGARAALFASMAISAMATAAAWIASGLPIFGALFASQLVISAGRLTLLHSYPKIGDQQASREATIELDRKFTLWSTLYATLLGATFYTAIAIGDRNFMLPFAVGAAVGFPIAFTSRSAGRPRLLRNQILAVICPTIVAFATLPIAYGSYFAVLFVGLAVCAFVIGQSTYSRIVVHYRINETNRRLARYDALTGLLNRFSFNDALAQAVIVPEAEGHQFALVSIDLDRFKEINDTLGHAVGDAVIVETAKRLNDATRPGDVVARLGGDEYVVLAKCGSHPGVTIADFAGRLVEALGRPMEIKGVTVPMTASIGVALYPDHATDVAELMKRSDIALYEAKRSGRGRFKIFDLSMQSRLDSARTLQVEIGRAVREDQFEAWFQPIQDIENDKTLGYEALARWRHPVRGIVSPDNFIPMAEQNGAIVDIGQAVLEKACRAATDWDPSLTVAVNLSPVEFRRPKELVERIKNTLLRTGLDPSRLYVEITESLMLEDSPQTRAAVQQLSDYGVRFSLDDFGVGYSSLSYIQAYPFSKIKIDRKFVDRIDSDPVSAAIIASVCVLAERTHMEIIAEGVETQTQELALRRLGIKHAQGYLYGRPVPNILPLTPKFRLVASR